MCITAHQALWVFHVRRMYAYHGATLIGVRDGNAFVAQFARPALIADPFSHGSLVVCGIGDIDVAAEANDIGKAKLCKIREQRVVTEAVVGQDGHPVTEAGLPLIGGTGRYPEWRCSDRSIHLSTSTATTQVPPGHGCSPG